MVVLFFNPLLCYSDLSHVDITHWPVRDPCCSLSLRLGHFLKPWSAFKDQTHAYTDQNWVLESIDNFMAYSIRHIAWSLPFRELSDTFQPGLVFRILWTEYWGSMYHGLLYRQRFTPSSWGHSSFDQIGTFPYFRVLGTCMPLLFSLSVVLLPWDCLGPEVRGWRGKNKNTKQLLHAFFLLPLGRTRGLQELSVCAHAHFWGLRCFQI